MSRRHAVDPTTQAALFAPNNAVVAAGAVVEQEGGYYAAPKQETSAGLATPENPEAARLAAEDAALELLGRAEKTGKTIDNMSRGKLAAELHNDGAEEMRLGVAIATSEQHRSRLRRNAKQQFAHSIGIETTEITSSQLIESEGVRREVRRVVAKKPEERNALEGAYRPFVQKFARDKKARDARRGQIAAELGSLRTPSLEVA